MNRITNFKFLFTLITPIVSIFASEQEGILKSVGVIAKSENLRPSCFIMHADQEDPKILALQIEIIKILRVTGMNVKCAYQGDNNGLPIGGNIQQYMREGILNSDFIFALYSPKFFERSMCPVSGISTEINILTERLTSGIFTCFIPMIISGTLETSVPHCLRSFLAAQSIAQNVPFSINMFITHLLHLLYHRIFYHSDAIKTVLSSAIEAKKTEDCFHHNPLSQSPIIVCMSSIDDIPSQQSMPTIYMSSIGSEASPESQKSQPTVIG